MIAKSFFILEIPSLDFSDQDVADIVAEWSADLQQEFHVERAVDRILAVRSDLSEAEFAVHGDRVFHHGLDGVEAHPLISDVAGFGDDAVGKNTADSFAAKCGPEIEPLHFANARLEFVQRDASRELPI